MSGPSPSTVVSLITFCFGSTLVYTARTVLYPVLDIISRDFRLSAVEAGTLVSTYFVAYVAMQVPGGVLMDRLGLKRTMVSASLLSTVSLAALGFFASNYLLLLFFVGLYGFAAGVYFPVVQAALIRMLDQRQRGFGMSLLSISMSVGLILGLGISGPLYVWTHNWRLSFLILSVPYALLVVCFIFFVPEIRSERARLAAVTRVLGDRNVLAISAAGWCSGFAFWVVVVWGPSFFVTERGIDFQVAGLLAAVVALVSIVPSILIGRLSDRVGRKRVVMVLLFLAALMITLLPQATSLVMILPVLVAYGLVGRQVVDPVLISWLGDRVSEREEGAVGRATGLFGLVAMSSAILAPMASGWFRDNLGSLDWSFYLAGAILLLGLVWVLLPAETLHRMDA